MHNKILFGTVTMGLAFACYASQGALRAQTTNPQPYDNTATPSTADTPSRSGDTNLSQAVSEAARMVPAQAQLAQNLDANNLQPGEQFKAVLRNKIHLKNGVELPKGTTLVGTVANTATAANETAIQDAKSKLALQFTQAQLKGGQTIPIEATIVGVTPPATQDDAQAEMLYNAPPESWDGRTVSFDVNNALSGIDLHSSIAGQDSGVFTSQKNDLKLGARTQIALAIGPQTNSGSNGGE
jgi:hypothetical protein